tara:strand:- start:90 stop:305 length:216 start_codon:yes stop_codon:yes gene_type:complete
METTEVFLTFVVSSGVALILAVLKMCYKSKCSQVEFCCFKIVRNIEMEEKEDELELKMKADKGENLNDNKV